MFISVTSFRVAACVDFMRWASSMITSCHLPGKPTESDAQHEVFAPSPHWRSTYTTQPCCLICPCGPCASMLP